MAFAAPEQKEKEFNSFLYLTEPKSGVSYLVVFSNERLTGREMLDRLKKDPSILTSGKVDVYMAAYKGAPLDMYTQGRHAAGKENDFGNYAAVKLQNRIEAVKLDTYERYSLASTPAIGVQKDDSRVLSKEAYAALDKLKPSKVDADQLVPRLTRTTDGAQKEKSLDVAVTTRNARAKTSYERETIEPKEQKIAERVLSPAEQEFVRVSNRNRKAAAIAAQNEKEKEEAKPVLAFQFAGSEYRIEGMTKDQLFAIRTGSEDLFRQRLSKYVIRDEKGDMLNSVDRYALLYDLYHQPGGAFVFLKEKKKVNES